MRYPLNLWWADPQLEPLYRRDLLQGADRERAETTRSPPAERDWRVSRALLQQARAANPTDEPVVSLSHSRGHALVGTAPAGWRIGVDLEAIRPRDVMSLARWCCSNEEQAALACCEDPARRLRAFYLLWTLKEAFVKAMNLNFPADMPSVGLAPVGSASVQLAPAGLAPTGLASGGSAPSGSASAGLTPAALASAELVSPHRAIDGMVHGTVANAAGGMTDGPTGERDFAGWRLRTPSSQEGWGAYVAVLNDAWLASVVWRAPSAEEDIMPCWREAQGGTPARASLVGLWPRT